MKEAPVGRILSDLTEVLRRILLENLESRNVLEDV